MEQNERPKKYYRDLEAIVCVIYDRKDGTAGKVARGMSLDGKRQLSVIRMNAGAVKVIVTEVSDKPFKP